MGKAAKGYYYPARACAAGVKQCLCVCTCVCVCVCPQKKKLKNASSKVQVAKAFTDVIVNETEARGVSIP